MTTGRAAAMTSEPVCGETYDHTLNLIDERDGSRTYECTECGAEVHDEDEEQR